MNKVCISLLVICAATAVFAQTRRSSPLNRGLSRRGAAAAQPAEDTTAAAEDALRNAPKGTNGVPALVFDKAPMELVLKAYGDLVQKTIISAPDLPKAEITLKSLEGQVLEKEEYLEAIEVVLGMNGVVLEPRGEKFLRALSRKTVRTQGIPILMRNKGNLPEKGRVVSQMITFQNIAATEAQKALEGFKDPNGLFQVFERTNAILVTDTQENINRMLEIVREIDIASPVMEDVFTVQIKYALAADIKTALETIVTESQKEQPKETVTTKTSGSPGFTRSQPSGGGRLLNLNNRLGRQPPQPEAKPNETLMAAVSDADRGMIRGKVLILDDERSNKLIIITSKANMKFFDKVIETLDVETTPDVQIKVFRLKYAECEDVASMLNDLIGNASSGSTQGKGNQSNTAASRAPGGSRNLTSGGRTSTAQRSRTKSSSGAMNTSKVGELNKDNCKVLADKRINGVVVYARTQDMSTLKRIIDDMDIKLSQVLIETVIIEISLGDNLKTGIDWVMGGEVAKSAFLNHGQMIGGGGGMTAIGPFVNALTNGVNPIGKGINYFVKSDKLNLAAVVEATKTDSRTKYVASPIVMTVDNKEATIEATSSRQFLTGWSAVSSTYAGSGLPSPNYSAKDIGITLKITPKINPNGTVMLTVEEEYSQVSGTQSMLSPDGSSYTERDIDVAVTRKMSADISLENGESVILGGLTTKTIKDNNSGIPLLKDIPWVGKWMFGTVDQDEQRSELLVFMTPYVLDDPASAKAEALRRKNVLSDPNPWDDNGWSKSDIADPVSRKEQLRRFKDEWSRQDQERKTKLAIEKAKVDRAKALEGMDEKEREFWLELHKKELKKEQKEAFEKQMEEQKDLKELAASLRAKKLKEAEAKLKEEEISRKEDSPKAQDANKTSSKKSESENILEDLSDDTKKSNPAKPTEQKPVGE